MIINISSGGGKKQNTKVIRMVISSSQALTLPYTVTLDFKPTWIISAGYQNTSGGGRSFGEVNKNNQRVFTNASGYSSPNMYEPYVITTIIDNGFQFVKNPNFTSYSYTSFYGSLLVTVGDGDVIETLELP